MLCYGILLCCEIATLCCYVMYVYSLCYVVMLCRYVMLLCCNVTLLLCCSVVMLCRCVVAMLMDSMREPNLVVLVLQ